MFSLARISRAAPRRVISHRVVQPTCRMLSTENTVEASTNGNAKSDNAAVDEAKSSPSPPTPAPSNGSPPNSEAPKNATRPTSSYPLQPPPKFASKPAAKPNSLPFYQPSPGTYQQASTKAHEKGAPADIDWETSYHGIGTQPATHQQFRTLMEPLSEDDIEVKPDGIIYLPEIKYRRRLNEAFGPMGWGLIPRSEATLANGVATREYALVVGGRFVAQAQGENTYFNTEGMPAAVEGCKSNALMRCCKDLGIASELWDPNFIRSFRAKCMQEVWVEHATTKKKRQFWFKKGQVNIAYPWKKA